MKFISNKVFLNLTNHLQSGSFPNLPLIKKTVSKSFSCLTFELHGYLLIPLLTGRELGRICFNLGLSYDKYTLENF